MSETHHFSIPLAYGFGWCAEKAAVASEEGFPSFTYRFIPSGLWESDPGKMTAKINLAAPVYPTYAEFPANLIAIETGRADAELTAAGRAFYDSCPIYATLVARPEHILLTVYNPDGSESFQARAGHDVEKMLDEALENTPIDIWAKIVFEPLGKYFEPHPTMGFWPAHMQAPSVDSADWEKQTPDRTRSTIPRVSLWEKVIPPHGLFKTLYFSIAPEKVETARRVLLRDGFEILSAALAIRKMESDEFNWREHPIWKITVPGQYVGHQIKWLEDNGFISDEPWAVKLVWPVNRPTEIQVRFDPSGKDGWDIALVAVEPFGNIDLSHRIQIESDVVRLEPGFQR